MERSSDSINVGERIRRVAQRASKLHMIEYFMRQYPTLSDGLSRLVEKYEAERGSEGPSED